MPENEKTVFYENIDFVGTFCGLCLFLGLPKNIIEALKSLSAVCDSFTANGYTVSSYLEEP